MSLILDALNRSRQDANPVPGLATQHPVEHITQDRQKYLPWIALAVALLLIAWLVVDRMRTPPAPESEIGAPVAELSRNIGSAVTSVATELKARAAVSGQAAQPAPVPQTAPGASKPEQAPSAPAPQQVLEAKSAAGGPEPTPAEPVAATVPGPVAEPVAAPEPVVEPAMQSLPAPVQEQDSAEAVEQAVAPAASGATVEDAAVARLYQNRDVEEEPAPAAAADARPQARKSPTAARSEQTIDVEQILTQAREEVENASLAEHPVPFLANLSQQTKDRIPTLYYQRHDYSSNASQSSVVLNGETLKVGGSPIPGMKVDEILPDSVVLTYQGTQFRLRALNSWINL